MTGCCIVNATKLDAIVSAAASASGLLLLLLLLLLAALPFLFSGVHCSNHQ